MGVSPKNTEKKWGFSAVARGGAEGGAVPPQFFFQKVKIDLYKLSKIKYYQATVCEVFKNDLPITSTFASKATQTV